MRKPVLSTVLIGLMMTAKAPDPNLGYAGVKRNLASKAVLIDAWLLLGLVVLGLSSCSDLLPDPVISPTTDTIIRVDTIVQIDTIVQVDTVVCIDTVLQIDTVFVGGASDSVVFAAIGDYGDAGGPARQVSELVKSWNPAFIITLGDNNYAQGISRRSSKTSLSTTTISSTTLMPRKDTQCEGRAAIDKTNRFFPSIGNHDAYSSTSYQPYLSFFTLPGKETYYDFERGSVHFFVLNSSDGDSSRCCDTEQAVWLKEELARSTSLFNIVYFHHPPYSSSEHGSNATMQWPFEEWGASAVLTGHDHVYERITRKDSPGFPYLVNGLSGRQEIYPCNVHPLDQAVFDSFCYNKNYGAIRATIAGNRLTFQFYTIDQPSRLIDEVILIH